MGNSTSDRLLQTTATSAPLFQPPSSFLHFSPEGSALPPRRVQRITRSLHASPARIQKQTRNRPRPWAAQCALSLALSRSLSLSFSHLPPGYLAHSRCHANDSADHLILCFTQIEKETDGTIIFPRPFRKVCEVITVTQSRRRPTCVISSSPSPPSPPPFTPSAVVRQHLPR